MKDKIPFLDRKNSIFLDEKSRMSHQWSRADVAYRYVKKWSYGCNFADRKLCIRGSFQALAKAISILFDHHNLFSPAVSTSSVYTSLVSNTYPVVCWAVLLRSFPENSIDIYRLQSGVISPGNSTQLVSILGKADSGHYFFNGAERRRLQSSQKAIEPPLTPRRRIALSMNATPPTVLRVLALRQTSSLLLRGS